MVGLAVIANMDAEAIIKSHFISKMPDDELDEEIRNAYDRWNWESGSTEDKRTLELLENERLYRRARGFKMERVKTSRGESTIKRVPIE